MRSEAHRLTRGFFRDAGDLIDYAAGPDDADPGFHRALAAALAHLERLLGDRLVWKYSDPELAASAHVACDRAPARLYLTSGHPARPKRLEAVVAERDAVAAARHAAPAAAVSLAKLRAFRL